MSNSSEIQNRLEEVRGRIHRACERVGREPSSVQLIAVSKTVPPERVLEAADAGQLLFGENYLQEAKEKIQSLSRLVQWGAEIQVVDASEVRFHGEVLRFHCIGHLQRNKVREAVRLFEVIHTVDSLRLCDEIEKEARRIGKQQQVLLQVNVSGEESKWGAPEEEVEALLRHAVRCEHVSVQGLMTIGEFYPDDAPDTVRRRDFVRLRSVRDSLEKRVGVGLPHLSMGMSHDFEEAIEEGATYVRVGSKIFGARM